MSPCNFHYNYKAVNAGVELQVEQKNGSSGRTRIRVKT